MAQQINVKIYDQGNKLDEVNKKMGDQVQDVKKANEELAEAREITAKRNKNMMCYIIFVVCGVIILGASIYFMFFDKKS